MNSNTLIQLAPLVFLIFIMYFLLIRPQKKKEKAINAMRSQIKVGDDIVTIGGLCGKVVKVKEETIVIQVGAEKLKFEMMKWSVSKVVNSDESKVSSRKARPVEEESTEETSSKRALPKRMVKNELSEDSVEPVEVKNASSEETPEEK